MTYTGKVKDGVVVFEGQKPPDGITVRVEPVDTSVPVKEPDAQSTIGHRLLKYAGAAGEGLPSDLARNHDHYLHDQPKQ